MSQNFGGRGAVFIFAVFIYSLLCSCQSASSFAGAAVRKPKVSSEGILWLDPNQESAWFIPEVLIAAYPLTELPFSADQREVLRARIENWPPKSNRPFNSSGKVSLCTDSGSVQFPYPIPEATDLEGMIADSQVTFVGTVESEEPGWDAWRRVVATRLVVRVERTIKPISLASDEVSVVLSGGSMTVQGKKICTDQNPWFHQPRPGERILILGSFGPSGLHWVIAPRSFFVIRDGQIEPQPYSYLRDRRPRNLEEILRAFSSRPDPT
ncbi:MAG: hypothetical protein ABJC13_14240 [Acidobacteriota bacterium]